MGVDGSVEDADLAQGPRFAQSGDSAYLSMELVGATGLPLLFLGLGDLNVAWPGCGCVFHATQEFVYPAPDATIDLRDGRPPLPDLHGDTLDAS